MRFCQRQLSALAFCYMIGTRRGLSVPAVPKCSPPKITPHLPTKIEPREPLAPCNPRNPRGPRRKTTPTATKPGFLIFFLRDTTVQDAANRRGAGDPRDNSRGQP